MERYGYTNIRDAEDLYGHTRLYKNLPERPYCSNGKRIRKTSIRPKEKAIKYRYIQINHPKFLRYIIFDLDYKGSAFAWDDKCLPPFSLTVINRQNAHCHGIYEIDPVFMKTASKKTLKLLKHVIAAYKELLNADKVITTQKQLVKNPFHRDWELISNGNKYTLRELAEYIKYDRTRNKKERVLNNHINPSSRNVTLFDRGRFYAYGIVSKLNRFDELYNEVERYITDVNIHEIPEYFHSSLPTSEIRSITRSISKWVWKNRQNFMKKKPVKSDCKTGVMGFEPIRGLSYKAYLREVKRRQSLAGKRTSAMRREKTLKLLIESYIKLNHKGRVTQKMISKDTGYSIRTVKYYWQEIKKGAKRSYQGNSRQGMHTVCHGMDYRAVDIPCIINLNVTGPPGWTGVAATDTG